MFTVGSIVIIIVGRCVVVEAQQNLRQIVDVLRFRSEW